MTLSLARLVRQAPGTNLAFRTSGPTLTLGEVVTKRLGILLIFSFLFFRCSQSVGPVGPPIGKPGGPVVRNQLPVLANSVLYWNQVFLDCVRQSLVSPPVASRAGAILHLAIFEALNTSVPLSPYINYPGYIPPGLPPGPLAPDGLIAGAAVQALSNLFPSQRPFIRQRLLACPFRELPNPLSTVSFQYGMAVATSVGRSRAGDLNVPPVVPRNGSITQYQPTPGNPPVPLLPFWGNIPPFAMPNEGFTRVRPDGSLYGPPADPNVPVFLEALSQVRSKGARVASTRTPFETETALFWNDGPGTFTPPGHWNLITQALVAEAKLNLLDSARAFALVNLALADAAIGSWRMKYFYFYWRPFTAINSAGTPVPWISLARSPDYAEYPSAHAAFASAAASVLARLFGPNTPFVTASGVWPNPGFRPFPNVVVAAEEAGMSRIFAGTNYMFSNLDGRVLGRSVGDFVVTQYLLPRR